jgi:hypothetical protein
MNEYCASASTTLREDSSCTDNTSTQRYQQYYYYVTTSSGEQELVYIDPRPRWESFISERFPRLSVKYRILQTFKSRVIEVVRQYHIKIFKHRQPHYWHKCCSLR